MKNSVGEAIAWQDAGSYNISVVLLLPWAGYRTTIPTSRGFTT